MSEPTRSDTSGSYIRPRDDAAADALLESYFDNEPKQKEFPAREQAEAWKNRLKKAVTWIRKHEIYDYATGETFEEHFRATPKVDEIVRVDGNAEYPRSRIPDARIAQLRAENYHVEFFWRVSYWAHKPENRGFRASGKDTLRKAVENSARTRGRALPDTPGMPARPGIHPEPEPELEPEIDSAPAQLRRIVLHRQPLHAIPRAPAGSFITFEKPPGHRCPGGFSVRRRTFTGYLRNGCDIPVFPV